MRLNWQLIVGAKDCGSLVSQKPITQLKVDLGLVLLARSIGDGQLAIKSFLASGEPVKDAA